MTELTVAEPVLTAEFDRLSDVMGVIYEHIEDATCGLFFCRNCAGDPMNTIYYDDGVQVDICYSYEYFEVFGLTEKEEKRLEKFYRSIKGERI